MGAHLLYKAVALALILLAGDSAAQTTESKFATYEPCIQCSDIATLWDSAGSLDLCIYPTGVISLHSF